RGPHDRRVVHVRGRRRLHGGSDNRRPDRGRYPHRDGRLLQRSAWRVRERSAGHVPERSERRIPMNSIPRFTRTIGDETESQFWWFVSGQLLDLSSGYTYAATLYRNDDPTKANVFGTAKTTGFTGQAGSGTKGN